MIFPMKKIMSSDSCFGKEVTEDEEASEQKGFKA